MIGPIRFIQPIISCKNFLPQQLQFSQIPASLFAERDGRIDEKGENMAHDINVLALVKGAETYVFLYSDESRVELLRTLSRYAANPSLTFNWYDAAVLSQKIRQEAITSPRTSRIHISNNN